jgi:hypothetical protein
VTPGALLAGSPQGTPCQNKNNSPRPTRPERTDPSRPAPAPDASKSVRACWNDAWSFHLVHRKTGEETVHPFRCGSWRCPDCRWDVARSDFARILEGLQKRTARRQTWLLVTLTFDPSRYRNAWEAYRAGGRAWQKLRARLARQYGFSKQPARIAYVAVWERHKSDWPHVHLAISCPEIVQDVRRRELCDMEAHGFRPYRREPSGRLTPNWAWGAEVLRPLAVECGFGRIADVQFARKGDGGVAGYFAKLGAELVGMWDQLPVKAPRHFRRLRASRGLLPPRRRGRGEHEGRIVKMPAETLIRLIERLAAPLTGRRLPAWAHDSPNSLSALPARSARRTSTSPACPPTSPPAADVRLPSLTGWPP